MEGHSGFSCADRRIAGGAGCGAAGEAPLPKGSG